MASRRVRIGVVGAVCAVLAVSALVVPLFHHRGMLGWDSNWYLRQAAFFLEGEGVQSRGLLQPGPFVTWPLGYPLVIAAVARVTGLSLFWAGRVTSLLAALGCVLLVLRALPRSGWLASVGLLAGGTLWIFASTFAETIFILAVLLAAVSLVWVLDTGRRRHGAALALVVAAAFCVRYVGIVLLGPVLLACGWAHLRGRRGARDVLAASAVGAAAAIAGYMLLNHYISGHPGSPRHPRTESLGQFAYDTAKALVSEANFVFLRVPNPRYVLSLLLFTAVLALTAVVAVRVLRAAPGPSPRRWLEALPEGERRMIPVLIGLGVYFWVCMVGLKFLYHFHPLEARLLGPGTVLVLTGGLGLLWSVGLRRQPVSQGILAVLVVGSVAHFVVYGSVRSYVADPTLFTERMGAIRDRHADVEPGSIVVRGSPHLLFLRPDLRVAPPRTVASDERLQAVLERARATGRPVWLDGDEGPRRLETTGR